MFKTVSQFLKVFPSAEQKSLKPNEAGNQIVGSNRCFHILGLLREKRLFLMATGRSNKQTYAKDAGKNPKNWQIPKKRYNIGTNLEELHQMRFKRKELPEK